MPGLTATSVWMNGTICPSGSARCTPLTTPADTLFSKPNGEPIAITHSPRFTAGLAARSSAGRFFASILMSAMSVRLSVPMTLAVNSRRSVSLTVDFGRAVDDVRIGDDVAVGAHDEARAHALRGLRLLRAHARAVRHAAEALEEFVVRAVLVDILEVDGALGLACGAC